MDPPKFLRPVDVDPNYAEYVGTINIGLRHLKKIFPNYEDLGLEEEIATLRGSNKKRYYGMMDDANIFLNILKAMDPNTIFEIGTSFGMLTKYMAETVPNAEIHTLNIKPSEYDNAVTPVDGWNRSYMSMDDDDIGIEIRKAGLESRVKQHIGDSGTFDFSPFYERMDVVLVDANHVMHAAEHDLAEALKIVSPGGLVVVDDYWKSHHGEGVTYAVLDQAKKGTLFYHISDREGPQTTLVFHPNILEAKSQTN